MFELLVADNMQSWETSHSNQPRHLWILVSNTYSVQKTNLKSILVQIVLIIFIWFFTGFCSFGFCQYHFDRNMYLECTTWSILWARVILCRQRFTIYIFSPEIRWVRLIINYYRLVVIRSFTSNFNIIHFLKQFDPLAMGDYLCSFVDCTLHITRRSVIYNYICGYTSSNARSQCGTKENVN